jgi:hypothetical protein
MSDKLKCEVCGGEAVGVASSSCGPISHAYCKECLSLGCEPVRTLIAFCWCTDCFSVEDVRPGMLKMIELSLQRSTGEVKTLEQFFAEVKESDE